MKMEAAGKAEELVESEAPPKISENPETAPKKPSPVAFKVPSEEDVLAAEDALVFTSTPCLTMELRRDSLELQLSLLESDKPAGEQDEESDVSSHCVLSPSSSGHLADSDTFSSSEENKVCQVEAAADEDPSTAPGAVTGRKSRRSRSESDASTMAAKKNRQSSDKRNSRVTKVKGRSQKYRERIRLLRQKREAAARKKYNLLHISSTSDSDLTCGSSTSSSNDDEEVSGSSKTIATEIPDATPVVPRYDISDTNSDREAVNVDSLLAAALAEEHNIALENQDSEFSWRTRELTDEISTTAGILDTGFLASEKSFTGLAQMNEEINIASSDSEVEIIGVQENARCVHPTGGVIQSVSSSMHNADSEYISTEQTQPWAIVSPQHKSSPPEVVDLTLDEDSTQKYPL